MGTFCTVSAASIHHLGIMALVRKEQPCPLQPFYFQSVGFAYLNVFHPVIGSLCARNPLSSVPYHLEGRSSHH